MNFDITNLRLTHKIAILTLGVALFVAVAVGTMGDWMLRSLASDLQARLPSGVATLERLTSEGRIRHAAFRSLLSIGLVTEPITYKILIQPEPAV